jgi:hypothetical protein
MWLELDVPVPPGLARLCGYPGDARYVGLCWQPCGDECEFDDGCTYGTGSWGPYLAYTQHRAVAPALAGFNLGSSDAEPEHLLVIDGELRKAYVADLRTGRGVLRRQERPARPARPPAGATPSDPAPLELDGWQEVTVKTDEIEARIRQQAEQLDAMIRFLDRSLGP